MAEKIKWYKFDQALHYYCGWCHCMHPEGSPVFLKHKKHAVCEDDTFWGGDDIGPLGAFSVLFCGILFIAAIVAVCLAL